LGALLAIGLLVTLVVFGASGKVFKILNTGRIAYWAHATRRSHTAQSRLTPTLACCYPATWLCAKKSMVP
jgi:hypothetical protein